MKEDDIEKKVPKNYKVLSYSIVTNLIYPKDEVITIRKSGNKKLMILLLFNIICLNLLPREVMVSSDMQDWLKSINFLMPTIKDLLDTVQLIDTSAVKIAFFGFAWLWFVSSISLSIDTFVFLIKYRHRLEEDAKQVDIFLKSKKDKLPKKILAVIFCYVTLIVFIANPSELLSQSISSFLDIWSIPLLPQLPILSILLIVRWGVVSVLVFLIYYIYYLFFRKNKGKECF